MKKIYLLLPVLSLILATGCDDFLVKTPKDKMTPETFFRTEDECRLYTIDSHSMVREAASVYDERADYITGIDVPSEVIGNILPLRG